MLVRRLVRNWAPLVWLAPGEKFLPLGVSEFLDNVQLDEYYLRTKIDTGKHVKNNYYVNIVYNIHNKRDKHKLLLILLYKVLMRKRKKIFTSIQMSND